MRRVTFCLILFILIVTACGPGNMATQQATRVSPTGPGRATVVSPEKSPAATTPTRPNPNPPTVETTAPTPTTTIPTQAGIPVGPLMIEGLQAIQLIGEPQSGDSFYALTPTGLYITRDGGLTWSQVTSAPLQDDFVFTPAEPGTLYAGAGADCYRGGPDQPLYKSINGGATWSELPDGVNLHPVAVHPADVNHIWAVGCAGPAFSLDGGDTWATSDDALFLTYDVRQIVPSPADWTQVYIGGASEGGSGVVAQSQDGGTNWTPLLQESPERPLWWINDLLVLPSAPPQIFLIDPHGLWRSSDGGDSWDFFDAGLDDVVYRDGADFTTIGLNALAVDADTAPPAVYLGTAQGIYQSLDEGETWAKLTHGPWKDASISDLALSAALSRLFITTDEGVFVFEH